MFTAGRHPTVDGFPLTITRGNSDFSPSVRIEDPDLRDDHPLVPLVHGSPRSLGRR